MTSPDVASIEMAVLSWTGVVATIIFCAGYLWHRLKEAFPEFFNGTAKSQGNRTNLLRAARFDIKPDPIEMPSVENKTGLAERPEREESVRR